MEPEELLPKKQYSFPKGTAFDCRSTIFADPPRERYVSCKITTPKGKEFDTGISEDVQIDGSTLGDYATRSTNMLTRKTIIGKDVSCEVSDEFDIRSFKHVRNVSCASKAHFKE